jgi:hypothetical protein
MLLFGERLAIQSIWKHHPNPRPRFIAPNLSLTYGTSGTEQLIFFVGYGAILRRRTVLTLIWFWLKKM